MSSAPRVAYEPPRGREVTGTVASGRRTPRPPARAVRRAGGGRSMTCGRSLDSWLFQCQWALLMPGRPIHGPPGCARTIAHDERRLAARLDAREATWASSRDFMSRTTTATHQHAGGLRVVHRRVAGQRHAERAAAPSVSPRLATGFESSQAGGARRFHAEPGASCTSTGMRRRVSRHRTTAAITVA